MVSFHSLTSQWLNTSSMNAYQSCPSRNSFGYGSQIPSAVQSINSFPSLSNNIGRFHVPCICPKFNIMNGDNAKVSDTFLQFQVAHRRHHDVLNTHTLMIHQVSLQLETFSFSREKNMRSNGNSFHKCFIFQLVYRWWKMSMVNWMYRQHNRPCHRHIRFSSATCRRCRIPRNRKVKKFLRLFPESFPNQSTTAATSAWIHYRQHHVDISQVQMFIASIPRQTIFRINSDLTIILGQANPHLFRFKCPIIII